MSREKMIYEELTGRYPEISDLPVYQVFEMILESVTKGGQVLTCGNGGSAADADHIVGELVKGFRLKRELSGKDAEIFDSVEGGDYLAAKLQKGIPAISLNAHSALFSAVGNDTAYDMVFAQQVYCYGRAGDVLIAMTTSGNSANVVNAAKTAKAMGLKVVGITGSKESKLSAVSDICLRMPSAETYQIQEFTLPVYHALCAMLEEKLFGQQ